LTKLLNAVLSIAKAQIKLSLSTPWRQKTAPLFLTSALDTGDCSTSRPSRHTRAKQTRYPLSRRLGGPHSRSGRYGKKKKNVPAGIFFFWSLSLVVSLYVFRTCFVLIVVASSFVSTAQDATQTCIPAAVFEPTTPVSERLQTLALDRSAIWTGWFEPVIPAV
jgi:hypothetical protein